MTTNKPAKPSNVQDILARVTRPTAGAQVCLDGAPLADLDLVDEELRLFEGWSDVDGTDDPRPALRARRNELLERVRASQQPFTFTSLGAKPLAALLAAHPPREGHEEQESFNVDTFPTALVAASSTTPRLTDADVGQLFDVLGPPQRDQLFGAAWAANVRSVEVPRG